MSDSPFLQRKLLRKALEKPPTTSSTGKQPQKGTSFCKHISVIQAVHLAKCTHAPSGLTLILESVDEMRVKWTIAVGVCSNE